MNLQKMVNYMDEITTASELLHRITLKLEAQGRLDSFEVSDDIKDLKSYISLIESSIRYLKDERARFERRVDSIGRTYFATSYTIDWKNMLTLTEERLKLLDTALTFLDRIGLKEMFMKEWEKK